MLWYIFDDGTILDDEDMRCNYDFYMETLNYETIELPDNIQYDQALDIIKGNNYAGKNKRE